QDVVAVHVHHVAEVTAQQRFTTGQENAAGAGQVVADGFQFSQGRVRQLPAAPLAAHTPARCQWPPTALTAPTDRGDCSRHCVLSAAIRPALPPSAAATAALRPSLLAGRGRTHTIGHTPRLTTEC